MDAKENSYDVPSDFEESFEPVTQPDILTPSDKGVVTGAPLEKAVPLQREGEAVSQYSVAKEAPEAIVVHCGDPRFQKAFRRFVEDELGMRNYVPIIVLGGIHAFGFKDLRPKQYKVLYEQIKFLVKEQGIKRVVIINHEDCTWYGRFSSWVMRRIPLPKKQVDDLRFAAESLFEHFLNIEVETYYAELDGDDIQFKRIS
jgi:hypothetical protein